VIGEANVASKPPVKEEDPRMSNPEMPREMPTEAERNGFVEKLQQFRGQLTATERPMLDALVVAACRGQEQGDVEGYWFSAPIGGLTLAQVWWPYSGTATYGGQTEPLYPR
jgi:hypothetical protein